jgi:hypothetical protein
METTTVRKGSKRIDLSIYSGSLIGLPQLKAQGSRSGYFRREAEMDFCVLEINMPRIRAKLPSHIIFQFQKQGKFI